MTERAEDRRSTGSRELRLGPPRPGAAERRARRAVEEWTRERFELGDEPTVLVAEVACALPGCPPLETLVAFWRDGEPRRQFKVFRRIVDVSADDVPPRWMKDSLIVVEGEGCDCC